jgi:hypothetical protein
MSEVDMWIEVMSRLGFLFIEETCTGDINVLEYVWTPTNHTYQIYFNLNTEEVNSLFCVISSTTGIPPIRNSGGVTKKSFYNQYINIFRQVKLEYLDT